MTAITNPTMEVAKPFRPGNKDTYEWDIVWPNAIGFALLHALGLYGHYVVLSGQVKALTVVWMYVVAYISVLGITVGAHRLFTHKCYKANRGVRAALITAFTISGQNSLWVWVRDHRQHHKYSDTDADQHNASRGFFFSHIGWLMVKKQPEVLIAGKHIDMTDMNADPLVMFQKKYYKILFIIFSIALPTLVPYYLWNENLWLAFLTCFIARLVFVLNGTWLVNSAAHIYGNRPYSKDILPAQNEFVSLIGMGEGWHNYHHSFPWDYKAAELGTHYNFSATLIEMFATQGWAWDLRSANQKMVRYRAMKHGDDTHPKYAGNARTDPSMDTNNNKVTRDPKEGSPDLIQDLNDVDYEYERLKRDAETKYNEDDFNEMFVKKDEELERHMRVIESIYKLED